MEAKLGSNLEALVIVGVSRTATMRNQCITLKPFQSHER